MDTFSQLEKSRFWILVIIVSISGFSQGMLLPLISAIFEKDGISSAMNGLNATGLYIGTLLVSPFMEAPLRRFGYKPIIIGGGMLVFISLLLFPLWKSVVFWYVLRLLIGIGDHALHFSTQTWITSFSPQQRLGRNIAIYGLSFGVGFAAGPLFAPLVNVFEGLPFIVSGILCMLAWSLVFMLKNDFPDIIKGKLGNERFFTRFKATMAVAWLAFLGPFGYGFLESTLNAMYPVYALRNGVEFTSVSIILAIIFRRGDYFAVTSRNVIGQDWKKPGLSCSTRRWGYLVFHRKYCRNIYNCSYGYVFHCWPFFGSIFSLGISYMSDLTPKHLLPTGNLLCGIFFSLGSLTGPFLGGLFLEFDVGFSFLLLISLFLAVLFLVSFIGKMKQRPIVA